jgi:hypothetical protein
VGGWKADFLRRRRGDPLAVPGGNRGLCRSCRRLLWRGQAVSAGRCSATAEAHDLLWLTPEQLVRYLLDVRRLREDELSDASRATSRSSSDDSDCDE